MKTNRQEFELEIFSDVQKFVRSGDLKSALRELRTIQGELDSVNDSFELAHLFRWFSIINYYMGDYTTSLSYSEKSIQANQGHRGDVGLFSKVRQVQALTLHRLGRCDEALDFINEAIVAFKISGDARGQIMAVNGQALILLDTGKILEADRMFRDACKNLSPKEFPDLHQSNTQNRAYTKNCLGRFKAALEILSDGVVENTKNSSRQSWMHAARAFALMHLGRFEEAGADLSRLYSLATLNGLKRETILYHEYFGLLKLIVGDYTAAEESFERALAAVPEISSRSDMVSQVNRLLAELHLAKGQWQKAHECGLAGLDVARRIPERIEIGACQRVLAQAEVELGKPDSARERYQEALELYTEFPHGYEVAKTRLCAAESGLFNQKESAEMLALANNYFTTEGLTQTSYQLAPSLQS